MKKILLSIVLLSGLMFLSDGDYLKKDTLDPARINIKSSTGESRGYLKRDLLLFPNRFIIYDKRGMKKGYLEKDPLFPDRLKFHKVGEEK